jgi:hypothetical protein
MGCPSDQEGQEGGDNPFIQRGGGGAWLGRWVAHIVEEGEGVEQDFRVCSPLL